MWNVCLKNTSCIYASSTVAEILKRKGSIKRLWADQQLDNKQMLFMPWNPSGCHLILLAVNIRQQLLLYLDPMELPCLVTNTLVHEGRHLIDILLQTKFQTQIKSVQAPLRVMQKDSSSCGVLVCLYAKLLYFPQLSPCKTSGKKFTIPLLESVCRG